MIVNTYAEDIARLAAEACSKEAALETIRKFEADGGKFRFKVVVDHPDYDVAETVSTLMERRMPRESLMTHAVTWATRELALAKNAITDRVFLEKASEDIVDGQGATAEVKP